MIFALTKLLRLLCLMSVLSKLFRAGQSYPYKPKVQSLLAGVAAAATKNHKNAVAVAAFRDRETAEGNRSLIDSSSEVSDQKSEKNIGRKEFAQFIQKLKEKIQIKLQAYDSVKVKGGDTETTTAPGSRKKLEKLTILVGGHNDKNTAATADADATTVMNGLKSSRNSNSSSSSSSGRLIGRATKVVTDIDDTVVSSGGHSIFGIALGGVDNQYKRGQFYPGGIQFALELSLHNLQRAADSISTSRNNRSSGRSNSSNNNRKKLTVTTTTTTSSSVGFMPAKISVLTARAKEFKFALALKAGGKLCSAYRLLGQQNGVADWGIGDVYYGSVVEWILQHRKGIRKSDNFRLMMEEDERAGRGISEYVFIGDTGEKDLEAGERMASKHPDRLKAIFMHTVYKINSSGGNKSSNNKGIKGNNNPVLKQRPSIAAATGVKQQQQQQEIEQQKKEMDDSKVAAVMQDKIINGVPVLYFRTYVGAAVKAYQHKMISKDALKRIARQAVADLALTTEPYKKRAATTADINAAATGATTLSSAATARGKVTSRNLLHLLQSKKRKALIESQWVELIADLQQVNFLRPYIPADRLPLLDYKATTLQRSTGTITTTTATTATTAGRSKTAARISTPLPAVRSRRP